jgi:hypothetical protein
MIQCKAFRTICLPFLLLGFAEAHTTHAMQYISRITAPAGSTTLKKMAIIGLGYWLIRTILNHKISRIDTATYRTNPKTLKIITDGKVTVRRSVDGATHVTHHYGATPNSALSSIHFSEELQGDTLAVYGSTRSVKRPLWHRILTFLFRVKPKKTLHHIIEVPNPDLLEITTSNSALYSYQNSYRVIVDSLKCAMNIHALDGNVLVSCPRELEKLTGVSTSQNPIQTTSNKTIEIHTCGKVNVENFPGNLIIEDDGPRDSDHTPRSYYLTRHRQNHGGAVSIDQKSISFSFTYPQDKPKPLSPQETA